MSDAIDRLEAMCAEGQQRWDLSETDVLCLRWALDKLREKRVLTRLTMHLWLPVSEIARYTTMVRDDWGLEDVLDEANPPTIEEVTRDR